MKRLLSYILITMVVITGCSIECFQKGSEVDMAVKNTSLLMDKGYKNGFNVGGLSSAVDGMSIKTIFDYGKEGQEPKWRVAQWGSRYSFADPEHTRMEKIRDNQFWYINTTKIFGVNTDNSELTFGVEGSKCYDAPRKYGEDWAHLLIEQKLTDDYQPSMEYKVDNMKSLRVKMEAKLTKFEDGMGNEADPTLHAAQFQLFLYLTNLNIKSKGRKDKIWFGIPLFDNRCEITPQYGAEDSGQEGASHQYIYTIAGETLYSNENNFWKNGEINASEESNWVNIEIDVLPHIKKALDQAHEHGFMLGSEYGDLFINGLNLGWEVPGTYDVEMKVKDFDIINKPTQKK